jgi:hypothetical protein
MESKAIPLYFDQVPEPSLIGKNGHPPLARGKVCAAGHAPLLRPWGTWDGTRPDSGAQSPRSRSAGSRGTRVGSMNTSAVMSIHTLAVMSIHSAQRANFVQIIGIPSLGLDTIR